MVLFLAPERPFAIEEDLRSDCETIIVALLLLVSDIDGNGVWSRWSVKEMMAVNFLVNHVIMLIESYL